MCHVVQVPVTQEAKHSTYNDFVRTLLTKYTTDLTRDLSSGRKSCWVRREAGFGKRDDRRHKINIRLKCAAVSRRIRWTSVTLRTKKTEEGHIRVAASTLWMGVHTTSVMKPGHTTWPRQ